MLAEEQRAVDHAYRCLESARRAAETLSTVNAAASGKDSIDVRDAWGQELHSFDLGRNALVFMRADVDEGSGRETFYIGRRRVPDDDGNFVVISWNAPAAVRWRLSSEEEPGDVRLLRQIVCDERLVKRYFDLHGAPAVVRPSTASAPGGTPAATDDPETPETGVAGGEAQSQEADPEPEWHDPLLDELERARDGALHDIVETIQRDQLRLVVEEPDGVLVVQGGPGTGKTAVGLHRVSWLLDNEHVAPDEILVVGPSREFLDYARAALVELGSGGVTMLEVPALWSGGAARRDPARVARVKADIRMCRVLRRAVDHLTISDADRLRTLVGGPVFTFELRRREVVVPVTELAEIAATALAGDSPYQVRRERCATNIVQHLTEAYLRLLPGPADTDYFAEIRRSRPVMRLLRRVAPDVTSRDVLSRLLSGGSMAEAAEGILTAAEQSLLTAHHESVRRGAAARSPSLEDLVCLDEIDHLLTGRPARTYGHLVVDEAQDLTPMQARSLARRCPGGSMTVLGDLAQATGPVPYDGWEELGTELAGRNGRYRVAELLTGFRVPQEVMDFVRPLGAHCAPGVAVPDSVRRTGRDVRVVQRAEPAGSAARLARRLVEGTDGAAAGRTTAVVVPGADHFRDSVKADLGTLESATVLTADEVKGLEFDHVVVVEPAAIAGDGLSGLRRLYVVLTRCTQSLTVVHQQPLPRWIGGPDDTVPTPLQVMDRVGAKTTAPDGTGQCRRYHADGTRCAHSTRRPDGWCGKDDCGGFRTAEPLTTGRHGQLRVPDGAESGSRLALPADHVANIRVTSAACGAFAGAHRGGPAEAAVELHAMLTPFIERGRHLRSPDGWLLDLDGYRLVLDADARAVTGYATLHAERSHAQFARGVPSRIGREGRAARRSALTPPRPAEDGTPADETTLRALPAAGLHVTLGACAGYERVMGSRDLSDEEFLRLLREELSTDLRTGRLETGQGRVLVEGERVQWTLEPDGHALVHAREAGAPVHRTGSAVTEAEHTHEEGNGMAASTAVDGPTGQGTAREEGRGPGPAVAERQRAARKDRAHESLRHRLLADLFEHFTEVGDSDHVDAWSIGPEGLALFEVAVGDGPLGYGGLREAALHLLEAAYLHPERQAEYLVVVLREPPAETWAADALHGAFSVSLMWREGTRWAGAGARQLKGTPVADDENAGQAEGEPEDGGDA